MAYQPTPESINRAQFLRSLGLSTAALSALYFASCSKAADTVAPDLTDGTTSVGLFKGNTDPYTGKINFTLDLSLPQNVKLKTIGQFLTAGQVVVANTKSGAFVALQNECTHDGGLLSYRITQNDFLCSFHNGLFNTDGSVKAAPPKRPVQTYIVAVSADGNTISVKE